MRIIISALLLILLLEIIALAGIALIFVIEEVREEIEIEKVIKRL